MDKSKSICCRAKHLTEFALPEKTRHMLSTFPPADHIRIDDTTTKFRILLTEFIEFICKIGLRPMPHFSVIAKLFVWLIVRLFCPFLLGSGRCHLIRSFQGR